MMGRSHAWTGAAAGAAILAVPVVDPGLVPGFHLGLVPAGLALAVCAGAALLPDIDHPSSTVSRTYGPVTQVFSVIMAAVTGGHRRGTHSLAGIGVMAGMAQVGLVYRHTWYLSAFLVVPLILALAGLVRLFRIPGILDDLAPIPLVLGLVYLTPFDLWYVPPALAAGALVHVLGDMITYQGCPVLWPFDDTAHGWRVIETDGAMERYVIVPLCWAAIAWAVLTVVAH